MCGSMAGSIVCDRVTASVSRLEPDSPTTHHQQYRRREVRLLIVGETHKPENRIYYPRNPERKPMRADWWDDVPERPLGDHDGLTDKVRAWKAGKRTTQD